jgi:hypothetical protein
MFSYADSFLFAVLITLVLEIPVLIFATKYLLKIKMQTREVLYWGFFVNLFSLPYLWFVLPLFITSHNFILIGEISVTLIEAAIFLKVFKLNLKQAFILSLAANSVSYFGGVLLGKII